jgi:hypothetical protein
MTWKDLAEIGVLFLAYLTGCLDGLTYGRWFNFLIPFVGIPIYIYLNYKVKKMK